jgi:3-isopropylmalate dehydrogenase
MPFFQEQRKINIALLPGDGQGPSLASNVKQILNLVSTVRKGVAFQITEYDFGGAAIAANHASALPHKTLQACREADGVIVCGCGDLDFGIEPEKGLLKLRKEVDTCLNIRPVRFPSSQLAELSSMKAEFVQDLDITFVRDLTSGIYYGPRQEAGSDGEALDTTIYTRQIIEQLARWAGDYAMRSTPPKPVHSIDKYNVMATSRLWRTTVHDIFRNEYPSVKLQHILVDTASMMLSSCPTSLNGIVICENMFGDILSDQAAGIMPSPDILPSASIAVSPSDQKSGNHRPGIFEPFNLKTKGKDFTNPLGIIEAVALMLETSLDMGQEADALHQAIRRTLDPVELIGSNARTVDLHGSTTVEAFFDKLMTNFDNYLEAINSVELAAERLHQLPASFPSHPGSPAGRRPMGIIEKILTHASIGLERPWIEPGQMVCVKVDWTITSELLWGGMEKTYDQMGRPRPYRNDRLWLAVDHTVDPRTNHQPRQRGLIAKAERFRHEAKIIDFLPANTSIMHTDFTRDRAQPGRVVVGSDSHTCSAGSMGSFAVGFGAADVVMPMVTGETWFRVPEICRITFVGQLPFGVGGKDVILHILGLFKRNTIAFQRAVEYCGPGLKELSMDARFAIANMTTEFGGMGTCFEADDNTAAWIAKRPHPHHREGGLYFQADSGACYAEERTIDLSRVSWTVALYPNPDHVVPVGETLGMALDGCFIGACTTTEEDLILGALVLEVGLDAGLVPVPHGKRRVTPGSLTIIRNLERHDLIEVYKRAGFGIGAPGCSYCVGINDVDVAGEGEVWLSSQNRNFRNRMGKGSLGNVTCAAVVAASSFGMKITDPRPLLEMINPEKYQRCTKSGRPTIAVAPDIDEPDPELVVQEIGAGDHLEKAVWANASLSAKKTARIIRGRVQRFAENVDT